MPDSPQQSVFVQLLSPWIVTDYASVWLLISWSSHNPDKLTYMPSSAINKLKVLRWKCFAIAIDSLLWNCFTSRYKYFFMKIIRRFSLVKDFFFLLLCKICCSSFARKNCVFVSAPKADQEFSWQTIREKRKWNYETRAHVANKMQLTMPSISALLSTQEEKNFLLNEINLELRSSN